MNYSSNIQSTNRELIITDSAKFVSKGVSNEYYDNFFVSRYLNLFPSTGCLAVLVCMQHAATPTSQLDKTPSQHFLTIHQKLFLLILLLLIGLHLLGVYNFLEARQITSYTASLHFFVLLHPVAVFTDPKNIEYPVYFEPILRNKTLLAYLVSVILIYLLIVSNYHFTRKAFTTQQSADIKLQMMPNVGIILMAISQYIFAYLVLMAAAGILLMNVEPFSSSLFNIALHIFIVLSAWLALTPNLIWRITIAMGTGIVIYNTIIQYVA